MNEVRGTRDRNMRGIYGGIRTHSSATLKWKYQFGIATWRSYTCSWHGAMFCGMVHFLFLILFSSFISSPFFLSCL